MGLREWLSSHNRKQHIALLIIMITAFFSTGFSHPDEHFQILELTNLWLPHSHIDKTVFNWDFYNHMRSWVQPFLYLGISKLIPSANPFVLAFFFRLITGVFFFYSLILFNKARGEHEDNILFYCMVWFIPFSAVRTSGESLSLSLFFIGYYLYTKDFLVRAMTIWGLMFLVRFQMAVLVVPLIIIPLCQKKLCPIRFFKMIGSLLLVLVLGILIDRIGYGELKISFWEYFYQNLVLGKSKDFGTDPFYFFLWQPLVSGILPVSTFILVFSWREIRYRFRDPLIISLFFFFLTHCLIAHKEVRFLTPIYVILACFAISELRRISDKRFLRAFLAINFLIMMKTSLTPALSRIGLFKFAYDNEVFRVGVFPGKNQRKFEFNMPFYMKGKIETKAESPQRGSMFLTLKLEQKHKMANYDFCHMRVAQYPEFIESFNFFNWLDRSSYFIFWKCQ